MKVAVCISGHLRTFNRCIDNIRENIIKPLKDNFETDIFLSTWNDFEEVEYLDKEIKVYFEDFFRFNSGSKNYLKYPNLCCVTTCDNAKSMWYKCKQVFDMTDDSHDVIIRIRPDIIYEREIDINLIRECISTNKIYMSNFHGKYIEVTKGMMDHFSFGCREVMSVYMNTFQKIDEYVKDDNLTHTAEGFLFESIKNIEIKYFDYKYSVVRNDKIEKVSI
jgi:hypothetical protein